MIMTHPIVARATINRIRQCLEAAAHGEFVCMSHGEEKPATIIGFEPETDDTPFRVLLRNPWNNQLVVFELH